LPKVSTFIADNFHHQLTIEEIQFTFDTYFINLVENTAFDNDCRLYNAIGKILQEFGVVNIEKDLDTGISQRQLRRLFEFYVGDTAKTFAKVVRFQNILRAKPSSQSLRQNKLFFDVGYYDQAHFVKEFKNFYGVTPSKAFGR
jgi:methylphosphotriester-DNA--protein-cysteine methyltransferase